MPEGSEPRRWTMGCGIHNHSRETHSGVSCADDLRRRLLQAILAGIAHRSMYTTSSRLPKSCYPGIYMPINKIVGWVATSLANDTVSLPSSSSSSSCGSLSILRSPAGLSLSNEPPSFFFLFFLLPVVCNCISRARMPSALRTLVGAAILSMVHGQAVILSAVGDKGTTPGLQGELYWAEL